MCLYVLLEVVGTMRRFRQYPGRLLLNAPVPNRLPQVFPTPPLPGKMHTAPTGRGEGLVTRSSLFNFQYLGKGGVRHATVEKLLEHKSGRVLI